MPKRKAHDDSDAAEPSPPKHSTRTSARQNDLHSSSQICNSPRIRSVRKPIPTVSQMDKEPVELPQSSRACNKQLASRDSPLKRPHFSSPSRKKGKHNVNPITSPHKQQNYEDQSPDDADELNLTPTKVADRCVTPPTRARAGRVLMHSVEITTPGGFPKLLSIASPMPHMRQIPRENAILATPPVYQPLASMPQLPTKILRNLPPRLGTYFLLQQRAMLAELQNCSMEIDEDAGLGPTNTAASQQLKDLLVGTVTRGEGNSCLVLGPRGSGKTCLVERAIASLNQNPIIIRLSGHTELNDRLALREVARQLSLQTGKSYLADGNGDDDPDRDDNPFLDVVPAISIPPPSHLPALISVIPTLSRPAVVILDGFDLFALHSRQALLYCLLDTVQSCRVGEGNSGIAVIGVTTRIDTINLLEKRVKSRFSGRILRTAAPTELSFWMKHIERVFRAKIESSEEEWEPLWSLAVDNFLADHKVLKLFQETIAVTRDIRVLQRILVGVVAGLAPSSPFPTATQLASAVHAQRIRMPFPHLSTLPYPSICLIIAAVHAHTAGHDVITFEMLYDAFREQYRASAAAPIQVAGGSISMSRCTREVLMRGFERLVGEKIFISVAAPSSSISPGFARYRSALAWDDVKKAVEKMGKTSLKKWLMKAY